MIQCKGLEINAHVFISKYMGSRDGSVGPILMWCLPFQVTPTGSV